MSRVATALLLLPLLLALTVLAPAWAFLLVAEVVGLIGVRELFEMAEPIGYRPFRSVGYVAAVFLTASFYPGWPTSGWVVLGMLVAVGLAAVGRGATRREAIAEVAITILGPLYAGLMLGSLVGLRLTEPDTVGRYWLVFLFAVIMMGDTGAYYVGRLLGRRRLAPTISPHKTVEGLVGGVAASVVAALMASALLFPEMKTWQAAGLGFVLSLLGVAGDLFESLLKRAAGVKNSSSLLPGHGGVLDRLDSLYFSAPALLAYLRLAAKYME
jgi:phosphatidate cytidylyltransferase